MKQTTYLCNRCGAAILENRAILEIKAGALGAKHDEPIDLCGPCQERFEDWLRGGRSEGMPTVGGATVGVVQELSGMVR